MKPSIIVLLLLPCLSISVHAFAAEVSMPAISGDPGAVVQIPINVDNAAVLAAYQFLVTFNSAVLNCTNVLKGGLTQGWDTPTVNTSVPGEITLLSTDPNLAELPGGSGSLAILECAAGITPGASTTLQFGQALLSDGDGNPVNATTVNGVFTINGGQCVPTNGGVEICDNIDNDCDSIIDNGVEPIPITCGVGACAVKSQLICQHGQMVGNCIPQASSKETCNGIDDDCDDVIDNGIEPIPTTCGTGSCASEGQLTCQNGALVDSCKPVVKPETCNGIDDDCDGEIDDGIEPIPTTCGTGVCQSTGQKSCPIEGDKFFSPGLGGKQMVDTCTPGTPQPEGPFGSVSCSDSLDNDCDGLTDAEDSDCIYRCVAAQEICDGQDNDCDELIDEDIAAIPTTCGLGICAAAGTKTCRNGVLVDGCEPGSPQSEGQVRISLMTRARFPFGALTCSDQLDNDCDGATDAEDSDCVVPKLPALNQWVGKWFKISGNMQKRRFSVPDSTFSSDKFSGMGYLYFWSWNQDTGELKFDYYESTDQGTWDINTGELDFFAGTEARFFFVYQGFGAHSVWSSTGEMIGKIKNGILYDGTIKTVGGYSMEVQDNENTYSANKMKITGQFISEYEVPVPYSARLEH